MCVGVQEHAGMRNHIHVRGSEYPSSCPASDLVSFSRTHTPAGVFVSGTGSVLITICRISTSAYITGPGSALCKDDWLPVRTITDGLTDRSAADPSAVTHLY